MVIGIDFGNVNSFPFVVLGMDPNTRKGGQELSLLPAVPSYHSGIPSYFYYSQRRGKLYGLEAKNASPCANRRWMLKRRISRMDDASIPAEFRGQSFPSRETIDGMQIDYEAVIREMIQHIVRKANEVIVEQTYGEPTNEINLAYPVDFVPSELLHLVELVEKATTADGRKIRVVGTIPEPAAAALAYLNTLKQPNRSYNVAVYDLGGGTLDTASVTAYPNGVQRDGGTKYYEIMAQDGMQVGGLEFDRILREIALSKMSPEARDRLPFTFSEQIEEAKIRLSDNDETEIAVGLDPVILTRAEFESRARALVNRTVDLLVNMLGRQDVPQPDLILLTGGQSQMPLIRRVLEEKLPKYKDKIVMYHPQQAIAVGAARYSSPLVQRYNRFPLGLLCQDQSQQPYRDYVSFLLPAGSAIPTTAAAQKWNQFSTADSTDHVICQIYEARHDDPQPYNVEKDFQKTMECTLPFGRTVEKGAPLEVCLYIDDRNLVHMRARDPERPGQERSCSAELLHLG